MENNAVYIEVFDQTFHLVAAVVQITVRVVSGIASRHAIQIVGFVYLVPAVRVGAGYHVDAVFFEQFEGSGKMRPARDAVPDDAVLFFRTVPRALALLRLFL